MHSLKNTIVAVGLLGLSFVFYQMSAPDDSNFEELALPEVTDLTTELAEVPQADKLKLPSLESPLQLGSGSSVASGSQNRRVELPSPKLKNPLANEGQVKLPSPKITNPLTPPKLNPSHPSLTPPKSSFGTEQSEIKPRPEATFDFTGKSAQQRDQGLITALKSQSPTTNDLPSNSFQPQAKVSAQSASFVRDSAVVAASKVENVDAGNEFNFNPVKAASQDAYANLTFQDVWPAVEKLVAEKEFRKSLQVLTRFYDDPGLSGPQKQRLDGWLDALATKVVFSNEHHLAPAYISQPGDNLLELGRKWGVPGQLIYNINKSKIRNPLAIAPGTELKQITGPINATVSLDNDILTLFVDDLYAGRFNVKVGTSGTPRPGKFKVVGKLPNGHDWQDASGIYPPGHPNNHYGKNWIALEGSLCLHAVDANIVDGHPGCIGLSDKDATDLFSILSEGSTVTIR